MHTPVYVPSLDDDVRLTVEIILVAHRSPARLVPSRLPETSRSVAAPIPAADPPLTHPTSHHSPNRHTRHRGGPGARPPGMDTTDNGKGPQSRQRLGS